jgi:hypothetical protein
VEKYYGIAVGICRTREPALQMATVAGSDRNIPQNRTESDGGGFGRLALCNWDALGAECQFSEEDG